MIFCKKRGFTTHGAYSFPPDKKMSTNPKNRLVTRENWDWQDELYYMLAPYFGGWDWNTFQGMPVRRLHRWADKIVEDMKEEGALSLKELELRRALKWFLGGD